MMIEMRTKNGFSDFDKNLQIVKKFMGENKLHQKDLIYEELMKIYEPTNQI